MRKRGPQKTRVHHDLLQLTGLLFVTALHAAQDKQRLHDLIEEHVSTGHVSPSLSTTNVIDSVHFVECEQLLALCELLLAMLPLKRTVLIIRSFAFLEIVPETLCIGLARVGWDNQGIVAAPMSQLKDVDLGPPLHSLVIPGNMHFLEAEMVNQFALKPGSI